MFTIKIDHSLSATMQDGKVTINDKYTRQSVVLPTKALYQITAAFKVSENASQHPVPEQNQSLHDLIPQP